MSAALGRRLTHHSQTHTRGQEVADWSFGAVTSFLHPSFACVPAASQSECQPVQCAPPSSPQPPPNLPLLELLRVCHMQTRKKLKKNRMLWFRRHQLVFSLWKIKQRLSKGSQPLAQMFLTSSGWFTLSFIDFIDFIDFTAAWIVSDPSRLSLHLPLYHWVVVCNLFVILCNNFPHSDGFLQIWSPWNWHPLLSLFFVLVCQHVTNICFPSLLPWHLPPSLAHSRVTDQHPLLSAYRIHLALTV